MADATPQAPTTPAGDAAAGRDEVVEQAAEFIWDYIHGNWGAYEDVQEMAAGLAERGLLATPPTGDPSVPIGSLIRRATKVLHPDKGGDQSGWDRLDKAKQLIERQGRATG